MQGSSYQRSNHLFIRSADQKIVSINQFEKSNHPVNQIYRITRSIRLLESSGQSDNSNHLVNQINRTPLEISSGEIVGGTMALSLVFDDSNMRAALWKVAI